MEVGQIFEMWLTDYPLDRSTYRILDLNVKDEGQGTIKLGKIKKIRKYVNHIEEKLFTNGEFMIVEEQWFTANHRRKFKRIV